jgi:hypothetical protein
MSSSEPGLPPQIQINTGMGPCALLKENAAEMAKLQPVVRPLRSQNQGRDGNEVALLEPDGTKTREEEVGAKAS